MCSYQNINSVNSVYFLNENWEEEVWANVLSPISNLTDTNPDQYQYSQIPTIETVTGENEIPRTISENCQVQIATVYQNVESSSLLSPTWEESAPEISQRNTNMSTYFSTFNPLSQLQDVPINQSPQQASSKLRTDNYTNKNTHRARINFIPSANGTFKAIVKRKRKRTVFTTEQLEILEQVFSKKPYVTRDDRQLLVEQLQVNDKSIKVWFQNRRLKIKRVYEDKDEMETENNYSIFNRIDAIESYINDRTDEFGYVTLDDKIINDLVNVIDDYFSSKVLAPADTKTEIGSSPIYEPISPASTSDYSGEETTSWQPYEPNDTLQKLKDIESIIST